MSTPGAVISGLIAKSPSRGPRPENAASVSDLSTAPTVRASAAAPGAATVWSLGPLFPAATTNKVPYVRLRLFTAWLIGSLPSLGPLPRLILTTSAPSSLAAHSIPAMIHEVEPEPESPRTLPLSKLAPGATPFLRPPDAAPEPAIVSATWVPWPWRSVAVAEVVKLRTSTTLPARSG
jgi:hypothetical protein